MAERKEWVDQGWQVAQRQRAHPGRFRVVLRQEISPVFSISLPLIFLAGLSFESFFALHSQRVAEVALNLVTVVTIVGWTFHHLHRRTLPWRDPLLLLGLILLGVGSGGCLLGLFDGLSPEIVLKTSGTILILFALDRLERGRLLATLSDSEEYLESIFESIPDPLFIIGAGRRIVAGNRLAITTFGEEVLGKTICETVLGHQDCSSCTVTEVWERKKPRFEIVRDADGARRFEVTTFPLFGRRGFAGKLIQQIRDVSSQSRTEDDANVLADAVNSVHDPVLILDLRGRLVHRNRAAVELIGVDPLGAARRTARDLLPFKEEADAQRFLEALGDWSHWEEEVELVTANGTERTAVLAMAPIRAVDDRLLGTVILVHDVTELKSLQAQLLQNEKLSALGELISGVAHELNNPLTAVFGFAQVLLTRPLDEEVERQVRHIFAHAERCQKIIENLLRFARSHTGQRQRCDFNEVVQGALQLLAYQLRNARIEAACRLAPSLPPTMLDRFQIQQVLINLVSNAQHAIEATGRPGHVLLSTTLSPAGQIVLEVTDDGSGMPERILKKIFDPFFTTKEVGKGTGLGLSLSYGIVRDHGGTIRVSSRLGRGTTFRVELPVVEPPKHSARPPAAAAPAPDLPPLKVLVVDDEPAILELLKQILEEQGHTVSVCADAEEGLEAARRQHLDVVFSDWRMPGRGGDEFYAELCEECPHLRGHVVFTTGDAFDQEICDVVRRDGNRLLHKPFSVESVHFELAKVLEPRAPETDAEVEVSLHS